MATNPSACALTLASAALGAVFSATTTTAAEPFPRPGTGTGSEGGTIAPPFILKPGTGTGSGGGGTTTGTGQPGPAGGCTTFCVEIPDAPTCAETACTVAADGTVNRADGTEVTDPQHLTDRELDNQAYIDRRIAEWDAYVAERDATGSDA